jgi:hypothetical protein
MNFDVGIPELADAMIAFGDEKASSWAKSGILMSSFSGPDCHQESQRYDSEIG